MKPVLCYLRKLGHQSSLYIDDSLRTGQTYDDCAANVIDTTQLIDKLGVIAHSDQLCPDKSVFIPTHELDYLGFTLNSKTMQNTLLSIKSPVNKDILTLAYSTICDNASATESPRRSSLRDPSDPILANTDMVAESNEHDCPTANCLTKKQGSIIPPQPTQQNIWDMSIVLNHLKQSKIAKELSLKDLTLKRVMLMALLSGQRCQTLQSLSIDSMKLGDDECVFPINKLLKTTKPGSKPLKLCFKRLFLWTNNYVSHITCWNIYNAQRESGKTQNSSLWLTKSPTKRSQQIQYRGG
ncbi:Hypothetical predicted protein [Paramuricea clavata]|uniref:Uncharacterized protein n=1 Tax=Paramuricea clavata TaxID=317549 RepID=A0A6S7GXI2_PARCT|nr:Hypothetical predicted protein [Paramuricea clavata]